MNSSEEDMYFVESVTSKVVWCSFNRKCRLYSISPVWVNVLLGIRGTCECLGSDALNLCGEKRATSHDDEVVHVN